MRRCVCRVDNFLCLTLFINVLCLIVCSAESCVFQSLSAIRERTLKKKLFVLMKRTYNKLSSELLWLDTEAGFMQCSIPVDKSVTVENYHEAEGFEKDTPFEIGFDD